MEFDSLTSVVKSWSGPAHWWSQGSKSWGGPVPSGPHGCCAYAGGSCCTHAASDMQTLWPPSW